MVADQTWGGPSRWAFIEAWWVSGYRGDATPGTRTASEANRGTRLAPEANRGTRLAPEARKGTR